MRYSFWNKRIPTILGLILLSVGIGITTFLAGKGVNLTSIAGPSEVPTDIRITNITDSSFTVSYATTDNVLGSVNFGRDNNMDGIAFDDRDQSSNTPTQHKIHSITVKNLTPSSTYHFSIKSGSETFLQNDSPFTVTTASPIEGSVPEEKNLTGNLVLPDGNVPKEAIVYLASLETQAISSIVQTDGTYSLPLSFLRNRDLLSYFFTSESTVFDLLIKGDNLSSGIKISGQSNKIPTVTLSNDYDFTQNISPIITQPASSLLPIPLSSISSDNPVILIPKKNQGFTDQQPRFSGTAPPNSEVVIEIHSEEAIKAQVLADVSGNWTYRPPNPLSPGEHTITIITRTASGILRTVTQSFVVFAQGEQVQESATPSATPTITISVNPTQMPTQAPTITTVPTITVVPTLPPVASVSPTIPPIPPPGNSTAVAVGILGIVTTVVGMLLFLLSRGNISL
ncbi:MAG: fibronectin type III domain-containing protein [Candidatus Levybacteria bacterium]|nr:fibronectin type III domain-containing protein [Candidatus Levybacteria bacterium]